MADNTQQTAVVISSNAQPAQMLETPYGTPDLLIKVVTPIAAVLIRAAKAYVQTLIGLLTAAGFGVTMLTPDPGHFMATLKLCAGLAIASGVMSLLTNMLLLLTALGDKIPTLKS